MTTVKTKSALKERSHDSATSGIDTISKGSIILMGTVSALIGIWAVACFVGAAMSGANPVSMVGGWFSSIFGM